MKINRVIAAAMSAVMLLGFSGCDKPGGGSKDGIEKVMESYTDALTDFDGDSLFELTNWEEDSKDYEELEKYFNTAKYATEGDSLFLECVTYIASTIDVDYDIDELEANGKEATLKVTYKLVDWNTVYNDGIHVFQSYGDVLESLKSAKDTVSIKGKISFELDGKEWKISKIAKIKDVLEFAKVDPYINPVLPDPTETQPSETSGTTETGGTTETSETGSTIDVAEVYPKAISAYIDVLEKFEPFIRNCQTIYGEDYCSLCDLDSNGIPEMYFIAADNIEDAYSSASLYIYSYDEKTGKAVEAVKVPEILYQAEGANFIVFATPTDLIISHEHGESSFHQIETDAYTNEFMYYSSYRCDVTYEYDPVNDTENYTYEYYMGFSGTMTNINDGLYNMMLEGYVKNCNLVLAANFWPDKDDVRYRVANAPENHMYDYDSLMEYLESEK